MGEDVKNSDAKRSGAELKDIMDKLSAIEDMHNLTQLDIVNLKNEIEKIRLVSPSPIPPELESKIVELEKLAKDSELFNQWKKTVEEVKFLRSKIMGGEAKDRATAVPDEIENIKKSIEGIRREIREQRPIKSEHSKPTILPEEIEEMKRNIGEITKIIQSSGAPKQMPSIDVDYLKKAIEDNRKTIGNLKTMISARPKEGEIPDVSSLKNMINENRRVIESLKTRIGLTKTEIPADANKDIENLHNEIRKLEDELRKIREEEPIKEEVEDEIQNLRNDLMLKLDDLKSKTSPPGEEGLKNAIEENKSSIERLRSLVTGRSPSAEIQALKGEMSENMKFMQELKRMVTEKKPAGKTVPVTDPETRKKLLQIEKNVESLSNKLQKMSEIKPIKIPEIPGTRGFRKTDESDMQNLRKSIDNILKKMDSFVSKEDMEKGFLERRLKTDKKMLTGGIYKEMEDIKKSILRNEDHVNNLVSDLEELKKEVSTIEKREWGKVGEKPDLEDIKERIEEIEHKLKVIGTSSPVFIE